MSFLANARGEFNPAKRNEVWQKQLAAEFPVLAEALAGSPPEVKGADRIPPLTLMIYDKDGNLAFSLSSRDFPRSFFGRVGDPMRVLESIEDALANEQGEWVAKRQNGR